MVLAGVVLAGLAAGAGLAVGAAAFAGLGMGVSGMVGAGYTEARPGDMGCYPTKRAKDGGPPFWRSAPGQASFDAPAGLGAGPHTKPAATDLDLSIPAAGAAPACVTWHLRQSG